MHYKQCDKCGKLNDERSTRCIYCDNAFYNTISNEGLKEGKEQYFSQPIGESNKKGRTYAVITVFVMIVLAFIVWCVNNNALKANYNDEYDDIVSICKSYGLENVEIYKDDDGIDYNRIVISSSNYESLSTDRMVELDDDIGELGYYITKYLCNDDRYDIESDGIVKKNGAIYGKGDREKPSELDNIDLEELVDDSSEVNVTPSENNLSLGKLNAIQAALDYLDFTSFSRAGLVNQLSSEYGSGYSREDAEYAVSYLETNHLVDWNYQAYLQALDYLDLMPFSRNELYNQLTSEYGGRFTSEQAQYALDKLGY